MSALRRWLREQWGYGPVFALHAILPALTALDEVRQATRDAVREAMEDDQ